MKANLNLSLMIIARPASFDSLPRWKLRVFERFSIPNDLTDLSKKPTSLTFVVEVPKQGHEQ